MTSIQVLRGTLTQLPVLKEGEIGFCMDSQQLYIGTGVTNILLGDAIELERLIVSNSQLQASNVQLKKDIADLQRRVKSLESGGGGGGGGGGDATTFDGLTIDHFVLY